MGGARTWQLRACRRVHLLRRLHIRSLLAVFLLNFVFFPHGRRPYWRESLAFFPHKRSTGTLGGQACLGWPRCLARGLALLQSGGLPCWCSCLAALLHADTEWGRAWSHLEPSNRSSRLPRDPRGDHTGDFCTRSTAAGNEAAMGRTASPTRDSPRMCNRRPQGKYNVPCTLCRSEGKGGRSDHPRPIRR